MRLLHHRGLGQIFEDHVAMTGQRRAVATELLPAQRLHLGPELLVAPDLVVEVDPVEPDHLVTIAVDAKDVGIAKRGSASDVDVGLPMADVQKLGEHDSYYTFWNPHQESHLDPLVRTERCDLLHHGGICRKKFRSSPFSLYPPLSSTWAEGARGSRAPSASLNLVSQEGVEPSPAPSHGAMHPIHHREMNFVEPPSGVAPDLAM